MLRRAVFVHHAKKRTAHPTGHALTALTLTSRGCSRCNACRESCNKASHTSHNHLHANTTAIRCSTVQSRSGLHNGVHGTQLTRGPQHTLSASAPVAYHTKALPFDSWVALSLKTTSSLTGPMDSKICTCQHTTMQQEGLFLSLPQVQHHPRMMLAVCATRVRLAGQHVKASGLEGPWPCPCHTRPEAPRTTVNSVEDGPEDC